MRRVVTTGMAVALLLAGGCATWNSMWGGDGETADGLKPVKRAFDLTQYGVANPEGVTLYQNDIYFTARNDFLQKPAKIMRITGKDKLETVMTFSADVSPLGLAFGADDNLYVCDNHFTDDTWGKSRLLRVTFKGGKPTNVDVVAVGFNHINGIAMKGNDVYVTETVLSRAANGVTTGAVFKVALAELNAGRPVAVKTVATDPHCLLTIETRNPKVQYSANGLTFDGDGNLFVCSFGDGVMWRAVFDGKGKVMACKPWVDTRRFGMTSLDGAHYHAVDNLIWVADLLGNSVGYVDVMNPRARVIARSKIPHDAADGNLDTPADVIRREDKLYVVNFNLAFGGHVATEHQAISVIKWK
ncbi:MAG: hypothetical protein FWH21_02285 [Kiritimatiellaeota bacterium]|nr:hypothetical protein [Kiritimatiellota bacterium]